MGGVQGSTFSHKSAGTQGSFSDLMNYPKVPPLLDVSERFSPVLALVPMGSSAWVPMVFAWVPRVCLLALIARVGCLLCLR